MKVGDYVRTNYGTIFKIENMVEIDVDGTWFKSKVKENSIIKDLPRFMYDEEDEIINKSSPNILELLEEHDFITIEYYSLRYDERVERIFEVDYKDNEFTTLKNAYCDFMLKNNEFNDNDKALEPIIKSIVTKEQFSQMEYRIGE